MRQCRFAVLLMLALGASPSHAFSGWYVIENDRFYDTDRYYTNGIQLSLTRGAGAIPGWVRGACGLFACGDASVQSGIHNLGQLMYTPTVISEARSQPFDRPWAGLLYYERGYTLAAPDGMSLTTLTLLAGVTGRASLAEQSQKLVHRLMDIPPPRGWDNQVGGSLGLMPAGSVPAIGHRGTRIYESSST